MKKYRIKAPMFTIHFKPLQQIETDSLYFQLIQEIANELIKSEQYGLVDFIQGRMDEITMMEDAYMDNQVSILENQSPEC